MTQDTLPIPALAAEVRVRLPQRQALSAQVIQGLEQFGRLIESLRRQQGWTLPELAAHTGVSWQSLALLEQGLLLPDELTFDILTKLGQALPPRRLLPTSDTWLYIMAGDLGIHNPDAFLELVAAAGHGYENDYVLSPVAAAGSAQSTTDTAVQRYQDTAHRILFEIETEGDSTWLTLYVGPEHREVFEHKAICVLWQAADEGPEQVLCEVQRITHGTVSWQLNTTLRGWRRLRWVVCA